MASQMQATTSLNGIDSIIDEDIVRGGAADSGYSSHGSLTYISPSNVSSLRSSVSHLQPIYENVQTNSFLTTSELTPTSQNIQRINEFHITSPHSSIKRSASSLPCTPLKIGSPKKRRLDGKGRSKAFRNLIDNIHVDENSENHDTPNMEFSPIKSMNVLQERNGKFERKGSFSSTPICEEASMKSMSVSKTNFFKGDQNSRIIRKTKSFSPSKSFSPLKNRWIITRSRDMDFKAMPIPEEGEPTCKPERKSIKRVLCRQNAVEAQQQPKSSNSIENLNIIKSSNLFDSDIKIESTLITPIKKIRRNLSFNLPQNSPKKELDKIIFARIPCSPQKQRVSATKRTAVAKTPPVSKRPLLDLSPLFPKRQSYAHLKHFDIVSHLAETTTAIQMILRNLEPKDIHTMYNVSKKWRAIVKDDAIAFSQRNKYLRTLLKNKENLQKKTKLTKSLSLNPCHKSPLKRANSLNLRKNSIVAETVRPDLDDPLLLIRQKQRRTKCPRCLRPSIISQKSSRTSNKVMKERIPFQRGIYCDSEPFRQNMTKPENNHFEFAECTNKSCGFKFCMRCECAFHENKDCPIKTFVMPLEPDDQEGVVYSTASKSSKHNLRRLCSLDKIKFTSME